MTKKKSGPKKASEIITDKTCDHGCGQTAKFLNLSGKYLCGQTTQQCPVVKEKNSKAGKESYSSGARAPAKERYQSLPLEVKDRMNWAKGDYSRVEFSYGGKGAHKSALISERGHKCESCNLSEWKDKPIPLELEHSDGDNQNNDRANLKLLCCNCHAQTDTWRGRNINSGKVKVSDQELLTAFNECRNIRQALKKVGLTPKGGNYNRVYKLIGPVV
jgi:hypothetical protein